MPYSLFSIWRPDAFHKIHPGEHYFEGWFYKIVNAMKDRIFAVIPGVFFGRQEGETHAFVQVLDGRTQGSSYHRFPISEFEASSRTLSIRIGTNRFERDAMHLDLRSKEMSLRGELRFRNNTPWTRSVFSPGVMGWYAFVPFMECYHGVVSLDHEIAGSLEHGGTAVSFDGGRGYIEKDWGRSFPSAYSWIQSNHFGQPGTGLMASVARIPWLGGAFRGFIIGFLHEGRLHRFATYTRAQLETVRIAADVVAITVRNRTHRLEILAERSAGGELHAPYEAGMRTRIAESLGSRVTVRLSCFHRGRSTLVFEGIGDPAGLEIQGNLEQITR